MSLRRDPATPEDRVRVELERLLASPVSRAPFLLRGTGLVAAGGGFVALGALTFELRQGQGLLAITMGAAAAARGVFEIVAVLRAPVRAVIAGVVSLSQERRDRRDSAVAPARTRMDALPGDLRRSVESRTAISLLLDDGTRISARTLWGRQAFGRPGDVGVAHLCGRTLLRFRRVPGLTASERAPAPVEQAR